MNAAYLSYLRKLVLDNPDELDLQSAIDGMLYEVREAVLSTTEDRVLERYVRYIQIQCTELMDLVSGLNQTSGDAEQRRIVVLGSMAMALSSLQKYYADFFDQHAPLPVFSVESSKHLLGEEQKSLYPKLKQKIEDAHLLVVVDRYLRAFLSLDTFSFAQVKRQRHLQESLLHFCRHADQEHFDRKLIDLLVSLDHRDEEFLKYYLEQIGQDLDQELNVESQTRVLQGYQKRLLSISLNKPDNVNQTLDIFTAYISSALDRKNITIMPKPVEVGRVKSQKFVVPKGYKIRVTFSVDVLAYLTRLYIDCGFYNPAVKNELFAFLAARIETPGIGEGCLSATSISNKYHQVVQTTAVNTRAMLMQMVKQIDREYNC